MNKYFGRRGTIFISAFISFIACIWQGLTNTWWHLFIARFILGFGIGPKSATVPVYAAECSPPAIRGALVMMWYVDGFVELRTANLEHFFTGKCGLHSVS